MIIFKQKEYSEYDAMRSLYVALMHPETRLRVEVISRNEMIPVLKGNSVVIEKFTITTALFNKDRYRMYLKIGAKAKLPDNIRLTSKYEDKRIGTVKLGFNSESKYKSFSDKPKEQKPKSFFRAEAPLNVDISYKTKKILGEAVLYDKNSRSLVLEVSSIHDAIQALNILPFGINYKLYLLDD